MCTLMDSFWLTYIIFKLKQYTGVIFHESGERWKIWRKTDLLFGKWHDKFGKFSRAHLKVSKLGFWWDTFVHGRKCMNIKYSGELCVMTMNNDTKFVEEMNCHFKTDMRNLTNLTETLKSLKKLLFNGLLWPKYMTLELKKGKRSYLWCHWRLMQNLKENWPVLSRMTWVIWQIFTDWKIAISF